MPEAQAAGSDSASWRRPSGTLAELTAASEQRAALLERRHTELERESGCAPVVPSFRGALMGACVGVIAELKRRSPSKGAINDALDVPSRAVDYAGAGAAALSVLTEPSRFGGSLNDLRDAARAVRVPLLRKDFIVSRLQLLEARASGASAVLLIASALHPDRVSALAADAARIGLDVLLEVRDEWELERALRVEAAVIGINNRNLETLRTDDAVSARLLPLVPPGRTAVYESGLEGRAGVERAAALGADAVLVGSSLSAAHDGSAAVAALVGVPRHPRG